MLFSEKTESSVIVPVGQWLTKRRNILLAPLFSTAMISARWVSPLWLELCQDLLGIACLFAGSWLRLLAASYHESEHDAEPITAGPYAWIRHPLYLSNFLLGLGIVLLTGWKVMILFYCLFFFPIHLVIARAEEIHLIRIYGTKYADYRLAVPALLPWRRYRGPVYGSRSSFKLKEAQEGLKIIGYAAGVIGILSFKQLRLLFHFTAPAPLPFSVGLAIIGIIILAIVLRNQTRSRLLRAFEIILAVSGVLLLALHIPGVLEPSPPVPFQPGRRGSGPASWSPPGWLF